MNAVAAAAWRLPNHDGCRDYFEAAVVDWHWDAGCRCARWMMAPLLLLLLLVPLQQAPVTSAPLRPRRLQDCRVPLILVKASCA
jgi:hypothetical protein